MSLWTSLEPASALVDPGASTTVRLRVRNTGDIVDEYRFEPVGDVAPWATVEPQTLRLYPGTTGTVELTLSPPRSPDATAGANPYAVRIVPTVHPEATTVVEGNLSITAFTEVRAELVPPTVKGRFRGRPQLAIDNLGNTKLTASIGSENDDQLAYDIRPANVQIEPGRAAFVHVTLKPRETIWFGSKEERPYTLAVRRSGTDPRTVDGTFVQRGFLPRWLATCLSVALALAITFAVLWFGHQPQVRSSATEWSEEVSTTVLPSPEPPASELPSPDASDAEQEALPDGADDDTAADPGGSSGEGGGSEGSGGSGGSAPEQEDKAAPSGPLPFRRGDGPNLFVQFAQVRMETARASDPCRLTGDHRLGVMDAATVQAIKCFQKANDERNDGVTIKTDGAGNLGRATMTALLMAHFGDSTSTLQPGKKNPEVVWLNSILLWADNVQYDTNDVKAMDSYVRANIHYLKSADNRASNSADGGFADRVASYQRNLGLPATGKVDAAMFAALHAGKVKGQNQPGQVTAADFPPLPVV